MNLSIVIVCTNEFDYLKDCIDSIYKFTREIDYEIIVVDNNSSDYRIKEYLEEEKKKSKNFITIRNEFTLGYPASNIAGFGEAKGDYIIFMNPDIVLLNNCLEIMIDFLERNLDVAVCGPRIFNTDGSYQVSFYSFPSPFKIFLRLLGINRLLMDKPRLIKFLGKFRKTMPEFASLYGMNFENIKKPMEVPWITGACFAFRRNIYEESGGFDGNIILYCDDMEIEKRIRDKGYKIYFLPDAKLIHTRGWAVKSPRSVFYYFRSYRYYYSKYYKGFSRMALIFLNIIEHNYERLALFSRGCTRKSINKNTQGKNTSMVT